MLDFEEQKKLKIRRDAKYRGWSLKELIHLGLLNIKNKTNHDLFVEIILEHFKDKTIGEVMEAFELIRRPFNVKL